MGDELRSQLTPSEIMLRAFEPNLVPPNAAWPPSTSTDPWSSKSKEDCDRPMPLSKPQPVGRWVGKHRAVQGSKQSPSDKTA